MKDKSFEKELTALINRYSLENQSDTPDYILSHYLCECLRVWESCVIDREKWWGREKKDTESVEWIDPEYQERRG